MTKTEIAETLAKWCEAYDFDPRDSGDWALETLQGLVDAAGETSGTIQMSGEIERVGGDFRLRHASGRASRLSNEPMTYQCIGSVRGSCGHRHRSLAAAVACLERDRSGCAGQGGYSDRGIIRSDGQEMVFMGDDDGWCDETEADAVEETIARMAR